MSALLILYFLPIFSLVQSLFHPYPDISLGEPDGGDPGTPLFLTPFVESGNISEGRSLSRVSFTESLGAPSYAGFFTVDKEYEANQFFWYFPAMVANKNDAPVILWLQGGPGLTSLYGLFIENGPLLIKNYQLARRKRTWALNHHLIYIDNPVGTGYSFTKDPKGYCTNAAQLGEHLYSTLIQFFQLFPELQQNNFIIAGEGFAGRYVPIIANTIHKKNPDAQVEINLKAIAIGNGMYDPAHQLIYSNYLYQQGLIDWNQAQVFTDYENKIMNFIKNQQWDMAYDSFDTLFFGEEFDGKSLFHSMTGFNFPYNIQHTNNYLADEDFGFMIQKSSFRKGIHVGDLNFNTAKAIEIKLKQDFMQSIAPVLSELLDYYNVLLYNGQLDIIFPYALSLNFIKNLNFTGSTEYATAERYRWLVGGKLAGYVKQAGRLTEIMVRNAGHMVPADRPKWALDMITRFTHDQSFIED